MLNRSDALEVVSDQLFPLLKKERDRLDKVDCWYRWQHEKPKIPRKANAEQRWLAELVQTPWLGLVVTNIAQAMYVDGYRSPDVPDNSRPWRTWQANDLDNRQIAIHRAALAYGQSFATVLPGENDQGEDMAVIRGVSPRKMVAVYADPAEDDWPMFALRGEPSGPNKSWMLRLFDDEAVHYITADSSGRAEYMSFDIHEATVCPVVRYANMLDLDGRTDGEVEPFIPTAARINKTAFDRLMTQHFASWKVRTIAGMDEPPPEEKDKRKLELRQDDQLIASDADTKFGQLDESPLDGFIRAYESDITTLAAVAQVPTTSLTGNVANLSADAIAEMRAGLTQKVTERQKSFGKSHDQTLRLAAALQGDSDGAADVMAHVTWSDMQIRSLSQAVDALGKASQMLGVPPQALWSRIPGVTKSDADEWKALAEKGDPLSSLTALLGKQAQPTP